MKVIISQNKKQKPNDNQNKEKSSSDDKPKFLYEPINKSNTVYLGNFAFVEQVDFRIRLVTDTFELYY